MHDKRDARKEVCRKGGIQEKKDAGKEGCRKGGFRKVESRKGGIRERRDSGKRMQERRMQERWYAGN